jgi:hypothetical protein
MFLHETQGLQKKCIIPDGGTYNMLRGPSTEKHICEKFLELMQEKSCFTIKVTELVKHANISRSAFYVYFDSIYDVIQKIEDDFFAGSLFHISTIFQGSEVDIGSITSVLSYYKQNKNIIGALCGPYGDPAFQQKLVYQMIKHLNRPEKGDTSGIAYAERKMTEQFIFFGGWEVAKNWVLSDGEISLEDMAKIVQKTLKQILPLIKNN